MPGREAYDLPIEWIPDEGLADDFESLIEDSMSKSERSRWAKNHRIGISDIGHCRQYVRNMIEQVPFSDDEADRMAAFVGTALGDLIEQRVEGGWVTQDSITVEINVDTPAGPIVLKLPGHPDLYHTEKNRVVDLKSVASLPVKAKYGPSLQQKFQGTLYAHALIQQGKLTEDCTISMAYFDRSGSNGSRPLIYSWKYDEGIVNAAQEWLSDVFEAVINKHDAPRDQERSFCMAYCPFGTVCRGGDTDADGLLLDQQIVAAANVYYEQAAIEKRAKKMKEQAAAMLKGHNGRTRDGLIVRTVSVGPVYMPEQYRNGYERLSVSPATGRGN